MIRKSEVWGEANVIHGGTIRGPFFNGPRQFAVYFTFDVTRKKSGKRVAFEEVAVYTVSADDKITREHFYYDGEQ